MTRNSDQTGRRRYLKGIGALGTASIAGLAGCSGGGDGGGSGDDGSSDSGGSEGMSGGDGSDAEITLTVGTAASATANYAAMQGLGSAINENNDEVYLSVRPNDGMAANVGALNRGEFDLGLLTDWNAKQITEGEGAFGEIDFDLTTILHTATTEWIIVSNSEEYSSYTDIDSNTTVSVGPAGTQIRSYFEAIFEEIGASPEIIPVGFGEFGSALGESRIDVGLGATNNAASAAANEGAEIIEPGWVQQIKSTVDTRILEMPEDQFETVSNEFSTFAIDPSAVSDGYVSVPDPIPGMIQATYLCGPADASYDGVYAMLETGWEQRDSMGDYHDFLTYFQYEGHWTQHAFDQYPFHAAAADFYKEVDIWSDDLTAAEN